MWIGGRVGSRVVEREEEGGACLRVRGAKEERWSGGNGGDAKKER